MLLCPLLSNVSRRYLEGRKGRKNSKNGTKEVAREGRKEGRN
jgi:hypothetical protein